ncbi:MAG: hypothetical protein A2020_12480 [Lentisphaerae bacterium GWF2_45_14]|nr:MAG: hypothetical protein A2020_12480 [Lentisphaerae bacterium GWF2_45_14]
MTFFKKLRYLIEFALFYPLYLIVKNLPLCGLRFFATVVGWGMYQVPYFRKVVNENLAAAFPEKSKSEIKKLGMLNLSSLVMTALEFIWFSDSPERIEKHVRCCEDFLACIQRAREDKKGLIFVSPHLGNWELAGLMVSHYSGLPFAVVARTMNNPYLNNLVNSGRRFTSTKVIPAKGAVKGMVKALKDGCIMATLVDQNTRARDGGVFVDFFGLPVPTATVPAFFARKFNVPVCIGGCSRENGYYTSFVRYLSKPTSEYADDTEMTQELMKLTEELVRQHPEQYLWFYQRFRYIPKEAPESLIKRYPAYATVAPERFYRKDYSQSRSSQN